MILTTHGKRRVLCTSVKITSGSIREVRVGRAVAPVASPAPWRGKGLKSGAKWETRVINRKTAETGGSAAAKRQIGPSCQHAARPPQLTQRKGKRKRDIPPTPPIEKRGREKKVTHVLIAQVYRARTHA